MKKMKTRSAAKKRFKKIGSTLIKRTHSYRRHLLTKKSSKTKRHLRSAAYVNASDIHRIRRLLPY